MSDAVVTRFPPSPTGFLHIGGARTALFNWLYARGRGGRFLLRIEDTDRARSSEDAVTAILDGLEWLGLQWDGEPIRQFSRAERHREVAEHLLASGQAYKCYATPEDLAAMREKARAEGRPPGYDGTWRDRDASDAPSGQPFALRLKAPRKGETVIRDQVQGDVVFNNANLDDLVILRSDGTPTYMLAVVVDDHDMGRHTCHPRRRSSDQCSAADANLQRDGLVCSGFLRMYRSFTAPMARSFRNATARQALKTIGPWECSLQLCGIIWCGLGGRTAMMNS